MKDKRGILNKLKGGDLRSIGRSEEVSQDILNDPSIFREVFEGMFHDDPRVRMRSADSIEKVSKKQPNYLRPFKKRLIDDVSKIKQQEVRWHLAQMFSYLELDKTERDQVVKILSSYIDSEKSRIVKVFSMQTLADLAEKDDDIRPLIVGKIKEVVKTGSPAIVGRGNKLITRLKEKK
jgi:SepF-like predicted cell division protein (DUF552 family)